MLTRVVYRTSRIAAASVHKATSPHTGCEAGKGVMFCMHGRVRVFPCVAACMVDSRNATGHLAGASTS